VLEFPASRRRDPTGDSLHALTSSTASTPGPPTDVAASAIVAGGQRGRRAMKEDSPAVASVVGGGRAATGY